MPVDSRSIKFGPRSDPTVQQGLPVSINSCELGNPHLIVNAKIDAFLADDKCVAQIFSTGPSDVSRWYHMWEAVTAIYSICVRAGLSGSFRGLGEHHVVDL